MPCPGGGEAATSKADPLQAQRSAFLGADRGSYTGIVQSTQPRSATSATPQAQPPTGPATDRAALDAAAESLRVMGEQRLHEAEKIPNPERRHAEQAAAAAMLAEGRGKESLSRTLEVQETLQAHAAATAQAAAQAAASETAVKLQLANAKLGAVGALPQQPSSLGLMTKDKPYDTLAGAEGALFAREEAAKAAKAGVAETPEESRASAAIEWERAHPGQKAPEGVDATGLRAEIARDERATAATTRYARASGTKDAFQNDLAFKDAEEKAKRSTGYDRALDRFNEMKGAMRGRYDLMADRKAIEADYATAETALNEADSKMIAWKETYRAGHAAGAKSRGADVPDLANEGATWTEDEAFAQAKAEAGAKNPDGSVKTPEQRQMIRAKWEQLAGKPK